MGVEFKEKLDILSITATETLNSIASLTLTNLVPKIVVSFQTSLLIRASYLVLHFKIYFQFFMFSKNAQ